MPPDRPVALVIGDDKDDVWRLGLGLRLAKGSAKRAKKQGEESKCRLHARLITEAARLANMGFA